MKRRPSAVLLSLLIGSLCAFGQTYQSAFENSRALLMEKRYSEALQEAQRAIALDGSQWGAYYVAGTALVGLERQGEAINLFQSALAHAPEKAKPTINTAIEACHQALANKSQAPAPVPAYSPQSSKSAGTWTDPATGLTWTSSDNGSDVDWHGAMDYCRNLQLAGHGDWRLSTIDELQGIYDANVKVQADVKVQAPGKDGGVHSFAMHVKGNLQLSGFHWSSTLGITSENAWVFTFSDGRRWSDSLGLTAPGRALCVRP